MGDSAKRWLLVVAGVLGAVLCGFLITSAFISRTTPGPGLAWWVTDTNYSSAVRPSQFAFMVFMYVVGLVGFVWLAWRSYRS
jgi:hypothetical protein